MGDSFMTDNPTASAGTVGPDPALLQLLNHFSNMQTQQQRENLQQMTTMFSQLLQSNDQRRSSSQLVGLKGGHPKRFSGHKSTQEDAEQFLTAVEAYFRTERNVSDLHRINVLISLLEGEAAAWTSTWSSDLDQEDLALREHPFLRSWPAFRAKFQQRWGDPRPRATAYEKLKNLRQTGSAADYALRFQALTDRIDPNMGLPIRFYRFVDGLKPHIRAALATRGVEEPETLPLDDLINLAISIDEATGLDRRGSATVGISRFRSQQTGSDEGDAMDLSATRVGSGAEGKEVRRQYRLRHNLCLYCGEKHLLRNCPAKPDSAATIHRN